VQPSGCLWVVSPWISDVGLLDNSAGDFPALTRFGRRQIRLVELLCSLAERGTDVVIATTEDGHNDTFRARLALVARDLRVEERVHVEIDSSGWLHTKSITTDNFVLVGSMNITHNGIHLREEHVELRTDVDFVAQARMDAFDRFGGRL
jgi:phosphatidylserine/phosphatidylglycerophosphate/cardiolipin synthase-like enzyme